MIKLDAYIIEKLKLDKDIKISDSNPNIKLNTPKEEDYRYIESCKINDIISMYDIAKSCKYITKAERLWITLMLLTKSKPFILNGQIYSYPGNFGRELLDKCLKFGFDAEDTYFQYDMQKDNERDKIIDSLDKYYKQMVDDNLSKYVNENISVQIKDFEDSNYTNAAKELIKKRNGIIVLPLTIRLNSKKVDAELGFLGPSYYHYSVNGKKIHTFQDFVNELKNELKA